LRRDVRVHELAPMPGSRHENPRMINGQAASVGGIQKRGDGKSQGFHWRGKPTPVRGRLSKRKGEKAQKPKRATSHTANAQCVSDDGKENPGVSSCRGKVTVTQEENRRTRDRGNQALESWGYGMHLEILIPHTRKNGGRVQGGKKYESDGGKCRKKNK